MNKIFRVFDTKSNSYIADDELFVKNNGRVFRIHPMDGNLVELDGFIVKTFTYIDVNKPKLPENTLHQESVNF